MEQRERCTRVEPKQSDREEQSKPVSLDQEKSEIVEQLKLLNYNLMNIGSMLGGSLGLMVHNSHPLDPVSDALMKSILSNIASMKDVNTKMGGIYEKH